LTFIFKRVILIIGARAKLYKELSLFFEKIIFNYIMNKPKTKLSTTKTQKNPAKILEETTRAVFNGANKVANKTYEQLKKVLEIKKKNIILFINTERPEVTKETIDSLKKYGRENKQKFRFAIIFDSKKTIKQDENLLKEIDIQIPCDFGNDLKIKSALLPYKDEFLTIVAKSPESNIPIFAKIVPHVPYLKTPSAQSLFWSINKVSMRQHLALYDPTITPKFIIVENTHKKTLKQIKDEIGFPAILKPAELAQSLLVSICFHEEELEETLKKSFKKIAKVYKENHREGKPEILVEQFFEGDMYSVDVYTNDNGETEFCPLVYITTGYSVGFDDFFSYKVITPSTLEKEAILEAEETAQKAIHALGLKNTTAHVELIKTNNGWKIIELGPRIGGFRHAMYKDSFNIDHNLNDALIRIGKKPIVPKKCLGYSSAMKFFAKEEGIITEIKGIKLIQNLKSFQSIEINKKVGDKCLYAKNGGKSVFNLTMFNKDRSELLADVRRVEQSIEIKID